MPNWIASFPDTIKINIATPIDNFVEYINVNWRPFFDGIKTGLLGLLNGVYAVVEFIPWWLLIAIVFALTWLLMKKPLRAVLYAVLMLLIGMLGLWSYMQLTLSIVIAAVLMAIIIGFPIGVLVSTSNHANALVRPILDTMQTMPSFVYLIPAVMLLGIGNVPAIIATTIYAIPPVIRMTNHGIRHVDKEVVEAAQSFGSTRWQTLVKVQIPQAMPTIMAGLNQTIMMALSMVVTCSLIGARGLGHEVVIGINRLEIGRGFTAGLCVVILAVIIDRLTQGIYKTEAGDDHGKG